MHTQMQEALAERLAGILSQMQPQAGALYFKAFIITLRREWSGIDRLRLDKFLMLIRRFVEAALRHLAAQGWCAVPPGSKWGMGLLPAR